MRDARYLRAQADWYLEMARNIADRAAADELRTEAARYRQEAERLEADEAGAAPPRKNQTT